MAASLLTWETQVVMQQPMTLGFLELFVLAQELRPPRLQSLELPGQEGPIPMVTGNGANE